MDAKKLFRNAPWISKDVDLDLAKFPIDGALKQTLSGDLDEFRSGALEFLHIATPFGTTKRSVWARSCRPTWPNVPDYSSCSS